MTVWWQYFSGSCRWNSEQGVLGYYRSSSRRYIRSFLIYYHSTQPCTTEEITTDLQVDPAELSPELDLADDTVILDQCETEAI